MKNMKNFMYRFGIGIMICAGLLSFNLAPVGIELLPQAEAQSSQADRDGFINDDTKDVLNSIKDTSGLPGTGFERDDDIVTQPGLNRISGVVLSIISVLKFVVGGIAVLYLTFSLFTVIASPNPGESLDKLKTYIGYLVFAIVIVFSADVFFIQVLNLGGDTFLGDQEAAIQAARLGSEEILGIVRLIQTVIGSVALLFLIIAGLRMVANAGNEEVIDKAKKQIIYSVVGLLLIMVSESLVREIFFVNDGQGFDAQAANRLILTLTNFISGFVAFGALLSLMYAGFRYVFTPADEDNPGRVKNAIVGAIVGIILAAGAFAIANTFIRLDPNDGAGLPPAAETYFDDTLEGI